jgi:hypothetical protein
MPMTSITGSVVPLLPGTIVAFLLIANFPRIAIVLPTALCCA